VVLVNSEAMRQAVGAVARTHWDKLVVSHTLKASAEVVLVATGLLPQ
tara:strand:- start:663 stop:803 length:141 start_codon:yes stop_codon:yes gene_type:complete